MSYRRLIRFRNPYVINENTKEIHKMNNVKYQCFIDKLINKTYINSDQLKGYLKSGYDGCYWCNNEYDNY